MKKNSNLKYFGLILILVLGLSLMSASLMKAQPTNLDQMSDPTNQITQPKKRVNPDKSLKKVSQLKEGVSSSQQTDESEEDITKLSMEIPNAENIQLNTSYNSHDVGKVITWGDLKQDATITVNNNIPRSIDHLKKDTKLRVTSDGYVEFILKRDVLSTDLYQKLTSFNIRVLKNYNSIDSTLIGVPTDFLDSQLIFSQISSLAGASFVEPNVYYEPTMIQDESLIMDQTFTPNDPKYVQQYGPQAIDAPEAWTAEMGDKSIKVAVIDTGINYSHPDLQDNYESIGYDWIDDDNKPNDTIGHGTHVAGTIAAGLDNGIGIAGVANVEIFAEKFIGPNGGSAADAASAISHAVNQGADILSNSWGAYTPSKVIKQVIDNARQKGVLFVAAAGNAGIHTGVNYQHYPSAFEGVISVGATDSNNDQALFSNFGSQIDIVAPGVDVLSTVQSNNYIKLSGTSMATPHVSGALALMKSKYPDYSDEQLTSLLYDSAKDLGQEGWDKHYGWGLVDLGKAMDGLTSTNIAAKMEIDFPLTYNKDNRINYSVYNFGQITVKDVKVTGLVWDQVVFSKTVDSLTPHDSKEFESFWKPTKLRNYEIRIYVTHKDGESSVFDNDYSRQKVVDYLRQYKEDPYVDYNWYDAKSNGQNLGMVGETAVESVDLPFDFRLFDKTFDKVYVSTNGYLSFMTHRPNFRDYGGFERPYVVSAYAEGLNSSNSVYVWKTQDFAVFEYNNHRHQYIYDKNDTVGTFEIVLFKNGSIFIQFQAISESGDLDYEDAHVGVDYGFTEDEKYENYNITEVQGLDKVATKFYQPQYEKDLVMDISEIETSKPNSIPPGREVIINGTLTNTGSYDRTDIPFIVETSQGFKKNITIDNLEAGESYRYSYHWISKNYTHDFSIDMYSPVKGDEADLPWWSLFSYNNYAYEEFNISSLQNYKYTSSESINWIDAKANGDQLNTSDNNFIEHVQFQYKFPFYDKSFSGVNVSANGYMTFQGYHNLDNFDLTFPETGSDYEYIISPFMESFFDWEYTKLYYLNTSSLTVIEFHHERVGKWQAILYKNGDIDFQYMDFNYTTGTVLGLDQEYPYNIGLNHGNDPNYYTRILKDMTKVDNLKYEFTRYPRDNDLRVKAFMNSSQKVEVGDWHNISAIVTNTGENTMSDINLYVYQGGDSRPSGVYYLGYLNPGESATVHHQVLPKQLRTYNYAFVTNASTPEPFTKDNSDTVSFEPSSKIGIVTDNAYGDLTEIKEYYKSKGHQVDYIWDLETQQPFSEYNLLLIGDRGGTSYWFPEQKQIIKEYVTNGGSFLAIGNNIDLTWLDTYGFELSELPDFMENTTTNILGHEITTDVQDLKIGSANMVVSNTNDSLALVNDTSDDNTVFSIATKHRVGIMTFDLDEFVEYDETQDLLDHLTLWDTDPAPSIMKPQDITYTENTTGHQFTWTFSDDNPDNYVIYRNGSQISASYWSNPGEVSLNVDGLSAGLYNYSIEVKDTYGNTGKDFVLVEVVLPGVPEVSNPEDITITEDETGNVITWSVSDTQNDLTFYEIYVESTLKKNQTISSNTIKYNVDNLSVGEHEIKIVVHDAKGHSQDDTVTVEVEPEETSERFETPDLGVPGLMLPLTIFSLIAIQISRKYNYNKNLQ